MFQASMTAAFCPFVVTSVLTITNCVCRQTKSLEDDIYSFGIILMESLVGPSVRARKESFLLNEMVHLLIKTASLIKYKASSNHTCKIDYCFRGNIPSHSQ